MRLVSREEGFSGKKVHQNNFSPMGFDLFPSQHLIHPVVGTFDQNIGPDAPD
jgi:hypothetical protein